MIFKTKPLNLQMQFFLLNYPSEINRFQTVFEKPKQKQNDFYLMEVDAEPFADASSAFIFIM